MLLKLLFRLNTFVLKTLAAHRLNYYKHLYPGTLCVGYNIRFGKGCSIVVANPTASAMLKIGSDSAFRQRCVLTVEERGELIIWANNYFNNSYGISCLGQITTGNDNLFGENVKLYDHNHEFRSADILVRNQGFNVEVIRQYEPWITRWVSEPHRGQSHAIRKGLAWATGDIINWINSDDIVAPRAFARIAAEFDLTHYDVLCGNCDYFVNELTQLDMRNERMVLGDTIGDIFVRGKINQQSTFFKAVVLKELDVDEQFHYAMDLDLCYRNVLWAGQHRVLLSEGLFTCFRLHETSKSVADSPRFAADINKVAYNILYGTGQPSVLLDYLREVINDVRFKPSVYPVGIEVEELSPFIRHHAWRALIYYNEVGNYDYARESLSLVRCHGQPLSWSLTRQLTKHYLLPGMLITWMTQRTA